jgi:hypothetical protein
MYFGFLEIQFGLKSVFDIVVNHGSPSFSMPVYQPIFGELYDIEDKLVADHQILNFNENHQQIL